MRYENGTFNKLQRSGRNIHRYKEKLYRYKNALYSHDFVFNNFLQVAFLKKIILSFSHPKKKREMKKNLLNYFVFI